MCKPKQLDGKFDELQPHRRGTHPHMPILVSIIAIPLTVHDLIGVSYDRRLLFGHGE